MIAGAAAVCWIATAAAAALALFYPRIVVPVLMTAGVVIGARQEAPMSINMLIQEARDRGVEAGRASEREAIIAWLRERAEEAYAWNPALISAADRIERGEHKRPAPSGENEG